MSLSRDASNSSSQKKARSNSQAIASSKLKKWLLFGGLFISLILLFFLYIADSAPPADEKFLYQTSSAAADEDRLGKLSKLGLRLMQLGMANNFPLASGNLQNTTTSELREKLQVLDQSLSPAMRILSSGELVPLPALTYADPITDIGGLLEIANLLRLRAECRAKLGQFKLASEDYFQLYRIEFSLVNKNIYPISYSFAALMRARTRGSLLVSLSEANWSGEDVRVLCDKTRGMKFSSGTLIDALCSTYTFERSRIMDGSLGKLAYGANQAFVRPNKTRSLLLHYYKVLAKDAKLSPSKRTAKKQFREFRESIKGPKNYFSDNLSGNLLVESFMTGTEHLFVHYDEMLRVQAAMEVLLALHVYSSKKGSLPKSLAQLVPSYLEAIPVDFDGQPYILYDAEKGHLLSTDPNEKEAIMRADFPHLKLDEAASK